MLKFTNLYCIYLNINCLGIIPRQFIQYTGAYIKAIVNRSAYCILYILNARNVNHCSSCSTIIILYYTEHVTQNYSFKICLVIISHYTIKLMSDQ